MSLLKSAHDCSEGGLAVALAECCMSGEKQTGAKIDFAATGLDLATLLFNESQSRIVITVPANNATAALFLLETRGIPARRIGTVGGDTLEISANDGATFSWAVAELHDAWWNSIGRVMGAD